MAARAKVLGDPGVDTLRGWVAEAVAPAGAAAFAAQPAERRAAIVYAAILSKLRLKDAQGVAPLLARLTALTAQDAEASLAVSLLAAEAAIAQGDADRALLLLPPASSSRAATLLKVQAQSLQGSEAALSQAVTDLQTWVAIHPQDASAWQLLSTVYRRQGQTLRSIRADAESRIAQFDYAGADDRFKAAQAYMRGMSRGSPGDDIEGSIIDTRARQVGLLLREQALER